MHPEASASDDPDDDTRIELTAEVRGGDGVRVVRWIIGPAKKPAAEALDPPAATSDSKETQ